jgi:hypothetical protein
VFICVRQWFHLKKIDCIQEFYYIKVHIADKLDWQRDAPGSDDKQETSYHQHNRRQ